MKNSLILLWFCFITISVSGQSGQLQVGTACVDVSPTVTPFQLRSGKSSYVHDPLHVRAIAFECGEGRAVICLIDAIGIGRDMSDTVKGKAAERTGWKADCMLICATHTHTAPKDGEGMPGRKEYEKLSIKNLRKQSSWPSSPRARKGWVFPLKMSLVKCVMLAVCTTTRHHAAQSLRRTRSSRYQCQPEPFGQTSRSNRS